MSLRYRHEYAADFPMASTGSRVKPPAKFPAHIGGCAPHPAQIYQVRAGEGLRDVTNAGSSRTPLRHARRARTIWQYWHTPAVVRAAPTLPGTTRIRLPPAPRNLLRQARGEGLPPPLESTAPHGAKPHSFMDDTEGTMRGSPVSQFIRSLRQASVIDHPSLSGIHLLRERPSAWSRTSEARRQGCIRWVQIRG